MNEKQRLESQQINTTHSSDVKSEVNDNLDRLKNISSDELISKYFQTTYEVPDLKKARSRRKKDVDIHYDFEISQEFKGLGQGKKFLIRTYGCQMNAHDTEVMAGILMQMGYAPTEVTEEADIILLNTCAIRENAENKVFGEIGHLKPLKLEKPDLILGVCGCMSQEESVVNRILKKHPHIDLIFGTHK